MAKYLLEPLTTDAAKDNSALKARVEALDPKVFNKILKLCMHVDPPPRRSALISPAAKCSTKAPFCASQKDWQKVFKEAGIKNLCRQADCHIYGPYIIQKPMNKRLARRQLREYLNPEPFVLQVHGPYPVKVLVRGRYLDWYMNQRGVVRGKPLVRRAHEEMDNQVSSLSGGYSSKYKSFNNWVMTDVTYSIGHTLAAAQDSHNNVYFHSRKAKGDHEGLRVGWIAPVPGCGNHPLLLPGIIKGGIVHLDIERLEEAAISYMGSDTPLTRLHEFTFSECSSERFSLRRKGKGGMAASDAKEVLQWASGQLCSYHTCMGLSLKMEHDYMEQVKRERIERRALKEQALSLLP